MPCPAARGVGTLWPSPGPPFICYLMQTTATATRCAPVRVPAEITAHLARFGLTLDGLLTDSNPKMQKGSAQAVGVILHHLPARALAAAITPGHRVPTPRAAGQGTGWLSAAGRPPVRGLALQG